MSQIFVKKISLALLLGVSFGAVAQQASTDVAEKSAAYIESLKLSDKQKKDLVVTKDSDKKEAAVKAKESAPKPEVVTENKKAAPKEQKVVKLATKNKSTPKSVTSEKDTQAYVASQQSEAMIAVYPELTAIYSRGGVYFVVLKLGSRTITAQDGETTICGLVKVLSLNSAKIGSQVLSVN